MPAEQCRYSLATAREGNVVHTPRIDTRRLRNQPGEDVIGAAGRATAPGEGLGPLAEDLHELAHVADGRGGRDGDHFILAREAGDRRRLRDRDRRVVPQRGAEHHQASDQERSCVAAGGPAFNIDELRQPDRARGAWDVLHLDDSRGAPALDHLLQDARGLIPAAARRRRRDDHEVIFRGLGCHARTTQHADECERDRPRAGHGRMILLRSALTS
jgi:hypothetical protein